MLDQHLKRMSEELFTLHKILNPEATREANDAIMDRFVQAKGWMLKQAPTGVLVATVDDDPDVLEDVDTEVGDREISNPEVSDGANRADRNKLFTWWMHGAGDGSERGSNVTLEIAQNVYLRKMENNNFPHPEVLVHQEETNTLGGSLRGLYDYSNSAHWFSAEFTDHFDREFVDDRETGILVGDAIQAGRSSIELIFRLRQKALDLDDLGQHPFCEHKYSARMLTPNHIPEDEIQQMIDMKPLRFLRAFVEVFPTMLIGLHGIGRHDSFAGGSWAAISLGYNPDSYLMHDENQKFRDNLSDLVIEIFNEVMAVISSEIKASQSSGADTVVLSVRPADFLLMSTHTSGWTSCYDIDRHHGHVGNESFMLDEHTAIALAYRTENELNFRDTKTGMTMPRKMWRQMAYLDPANLTALMGREYPGRREQYSGVARSLVAKMLAGHGKVPHKWVRRKDPFSSEKHRVRINTGPYHYTGDPVKDRIAMDKENRDVEVSLGARDLHCVECGDPIRGRNIRTSWGYLVCPECRDIHVCTICNGEYAAEEMVPHPRDEDEEICLSCEEMHFRECDECGEMGDRNDMGRGHDGEYYCDTCIEDDLVFLCDDCGYFFPLSDRADDSPMSSFIQQCYLCHDERLDNDGVYRDVRLGECHRCGEHFAAVSGGGRFDVVIENHEDIEVDSILNPETMNTAVFQIQHTCRTCLHALDEEILEKEISTYCTVCRTDYNDPNYVLFNVCKRCLLQITAVESKKVFEITTHVSPAGNTTNMVMISPELHKFRTIYRMNDINALDLIPGKRYRMKHLPVSEATAARVIRTRQGIVHSMDNGDVKEIPSLILIQKPNGEVHNGVFYFEEIKEDDE